MTHGQHRISLATKGGDEGLMHFCFGLVRDGLPVADKEHTGGDAGRQDMWYMDAIRGALMLIYIDIDADTVSQQPAG